MEVITIIFAMALCYCLGSVNFARIISNKKGTNITESGSGNPGTMNMLRTFGFKLGIITFFLDLAKGIVSALLGLFFANYLKMEINPEALMYLCGVACVIGHIFPAMYKFKGGKGIASSLGLFFVASPLYMSIIFVVGVGMMFAFRYGSLASLFMITSVAVCEIVELVEANNIIGIVCISIIVFLIYFAHRVNIKKLFLGEESRLDVKFIFRKTKKNQDEIQEEQKTETVVDANGEEVKIVDAEFEVIKEEDSQKEEDLKQENNLEENK